MIEELKPEVLEPPAEPERVHLARLWSELAHILSD